MPNSNGTFVELYYRLQREKKHTVILNRQLLIIREFSGSLQLSTLKCTFLLRAFVPPSSSRPLGIIIFKRARSESVGGCEEGPRVLERIFTRLPVKNFTQSHIIHAEREKSSRCWTCTKLHIVQCKLLYYVQSNFQIFRWIFLFL